MTATQANVTLQNQPDYGMIVKRKVRLAVWAQFAAAAIKHDVRSQGGDHNEQRAKDAADVADALILEYLKRE